MNRAEHLVTIIMEECAEVIQAASKINRFSLEEKNPCLESELYGNNAERLNHELNDIYALVEMLKKEGFNLFVSPVLMRNKEIKVEKYLLHSKAQGTLTDEE